MSCLMMFYIYFHSGVHLVLALLLYTVYIHASSMQNYYTNKKHQTVCSLASPILFDAIELIVCLPVVFHRKYVHVITLLVCTYVDS